jgi:hypothetical protein
MYQYQASKFISIFCLGLLIPQIVFSQSLNSDEFFINVGESISVNGQIIKLNWVRSDGTISIHVGQSTEILSSLETKIIENLEITSDETFFDATDNRNNAATLRIKPLQNNPDPNEHFLNAKDTLEINGKSIILEMVKPNGNIVISIDDNQEEIMSNSQIIVRCLSIKNAETYYHPDKSDESAATLEIYKADFCDDVMNVVPPTGKIAQQIDSDSWFFLVNSKVELNGKSIRLLDVYEDGTVVVQVGKPTVIIFPGDHRFIEDGDSNSGSYFTQIFNEESYYSDIKSERTAILSISEGFVIEDESPPDIDNYLVIEGSKKIKEPKSNTIENPSPSQNCNGCMLKNSCLPIGHRIDGRYCDISDELITQKKEKQPCQNNYECKTNQCSDGYCINLQAQIKETQNILQEIWSWISKIF